MSLLNYNKIVINLDKKRLEHLDYEYIRLEGCKEPTDIVKKVCKPKRNQSTDSKRYKGMMGCLTAHMKALQYAVKHRLKNIIILEDDAILDKSSEGLKYLENNYPTDICLLNGILQHPTTYAKQREFLQNKYQNIIDNFKIGVNEINYKEFRFSGAFSIYYPDWTFCQKIMDKIVGEFIVGKIVNHFDIYLSRKKLVKQLVYPSVFTHNDTLTGTGSNINCRCEGIIKNYCRVKNRKKKI